MRAANASAAPPLPFPDCCRRHPAHGRDRGGAGRRARRRSAAPTSSSASSAIRARTCRISTSPASSTRRAATATRPSTSTSRSPTPASPSAPRSTGRGTSSSGSGAIAPTPVFATSAASGSPPRRSRRSSTKVATAMETTARVLSTYTAAGGTSRRRHEHGQLHAESDLHVSRGRPVVLPDDLRAHQQRPGHSADPSPRARSTSTSRRRRRRTRRCSSAKGGQQAVTISWPGVDSAVITDVLGYQVLCNRGGELQVFSDGTFEPGFQTCFKNITPDVRCCGARPALRLFAPAGADVAIVSGQDPAERHHLRRGGRRDRSERQRQRPGHPLRDRDQDQELLRRLPQRRRSAISAGARHRRPVHAGRGHDRHAAPWPASARGSRSPRS